MFAGLRRFRLLSIIVIVFIVALAFAFLIAGIQSKLAIRLSQAEARSYAGILAGLIPIFVVALYVDGTGAWRRPSQRTNGDVRKLAPEEKPSASSETGKSKFFFSSTRWSGVSVTPLQLLSSLLGEVYAIGCYLVPTNFQIRFATFWMASLLGLFAFRLLEWAAEPDDELAVRLAGALGAILLLIFYVGYLPYILKIVIVP